MNFIPGDVIEFQGKEYYFARFNAPVFYVFRDNNCYTFHIDKLSSFKFVRKQNEIDHAIYKKGKIFISGLLYKRYFVNFFKKDKSPEGKMPRTPILRIFKVLEEGFIFEFLTNTGFRLGAFCNNFDSRHSEEISSEEDLNSRIIRIKKEFFCFPGDKFFYQGKEYEVEYFEYENNEETKYLFTKCGSKIKCEDCEIPDKADVFNEYDIIRIFFDKEYHILRKKTGQYIIIEKNFLFGFSADPEDFKRFDEANFPKISTKMPQTTGIPDSLRAPNFPHSLVTSSNTSHSEIPSSSTNSESSNKSSRNSENTCVTVNYEVSDKDYEYYSIKKKIMINPDEPFQFLRKNFPKTEEIISYINPEPKSSTTTEIIDLDKNSSPEITQNIDQLKSQELSELSELSDTDYSSSEEERLEICSPLEEEILDKQEPVVSDESHDSLEPPKKRFKFF